MNDDEGADAQEVSAAGRPKPGGSRVVTEESLVEGGRDLVQSRVKIDRFTGGAFPAALFSEQPVFGSDGTSVELSLTLRNPDLAEIGSAVAGTQGSLDRRSAARRREQCGTWPSTRATC